eukprot:2296450-Rhodomonas_salina.1
MSSTLLEQVHLLPTRIAVSFDCVLSAERLADCAPEQLHTGMAGQLLDRTAGALFFFSFTPFHRMCDASVLQISWADVRTSCLLSVACCVLRVVSCVAVQARMGHEEVEQGVAKIVKLLSTETKTHKQKLMQQHKVARSPFLPPFAASLPLL